MIKMKFVLGLLVLGVLLTACTSQLENIDNKNIEQESSSINQSSKSDRFYPVNYSRADVSDIERDIFELVNAERAKNNVRPLKWDKRLAEIALKHSEEISKTFIKHKSESGIDYYERLNNAGIIYLTAGENIYKSGTLFKNSNLPKETIDGWLTSPGHKSILLDIDNLYSHGAIGVFCNADECFVTMDVIGAEVYTPDLLLNSGYGTFYNLYDPVWDFGEKIKVRLEMNASLPIEVMVVIDEDQWDKYLRRNYEGIRSIYNGNEVSSLNKTFMVEKGYGLILFNNNFPGSLVKILIDYTS